MMRTKILTAVLIAVAFLSTQVPAQDQTAAGTTTVKKHKHEKKHVESESERQVRELREQMERQQEQIDALKSQISAGGQQLGTAQQSAADAAAQAATAQAAAAQASAAAAQSTDKVDTLQNTVTDLKTTNEGLQETVVANQKAVQDEINEPTAFHYRGITITPVAFFALEGVYRERSVNSGLNTPFNSIPMPGSVEGHVSEFNLSGRQSRLGGLFQGNAGNYKLSGYFEADFLSSGTTSNNNQSNSYTLRQRQIWGQAATQGGFTVTGGQMWSLVTEDGRGTDNRTEKLPNTIDAQYMVGFNWTRQPGLRLQQRFGDFGTHAFTMALSVEQAQITNFTVSSATAAGIPANFFFGGSGTGGGLYNSTATYANNVAPDVIIKGALDLPKLHFEAGGIGRFLRDYYFPIVSLTSANVYTYSPNSFSNTKSAGGVFGSIRVKPSKFVDVALQAMAGTGVGRYGSSQLADATLRPDGTLEPIRNYHGLATLETHPSDKLDVYAYYGGEYDQRTVYANANGVQFGYGPRNLVDTGCYALPPNPGGTSGTGGVPSNPANCNSPTRYIQEGMAGLTYRLVNSPKYGKLQYQLTYSYFQRNLWSGIGNATTPSGPRAEDSMVDAGMRYYIP